MANTIAYAQVLQSALDKVATQELLTGWMDRNAGKVKYNGGKEVKIPMISTDGLGDYSRGSANGYAGGDIKFEYKTYEMTQDRGRKFTLDAMDVGETNFVATAGNVMGEFQRTHVTPEIDAYRLSALAQVAAKSDNVKYSYSLDEETIIREIKLGIKKIRENGYNGQLVCHLTYDAIMAVENKMLGQLSSVTFSQGGIDTTVPAIDKVALIETPQNRMYSAIKLNDGVTSGQEKGGYVKAENATNVHFIIVPVDVPVAVTKQDLMRIFDPETNQQANAWAMDYRRYHDLWVLENKENSVYACFEGAKQG
jgi:hypothetical protein